MKKRRLLILIPSILIVVIAIVLLLYFFVFARVTMKFTATTQTESTDILANPWRGFYMIHQYTLSDDSTAPKESQTTEEQQYNSLAMLLISLSNYQNEAISDAGLKQLSEIFDYWKGTGKQVIVRFVYDLAGTADKTEPADIETVKHHIEQVATVVNANQSFVHTVQGVFLGAYGEMHDSKLLNDDNIHSLITFMADTFDKNIFLAVRTPAQWLTATGQSGTTLEDVKLPTKQTGQGELTSRLGLFNDGLFGSDTDLGTYASAADRSSALTFLTKLGNIVPIGGEAVYTTPQSDLGNALKDMVAMRLSYLDNGYDLDTLNKWKNSTYDGSISKTTSPFQGKTGYEFIQAHLGYRFVIRGATLADGNRSNTLDIALDNVGFANPYHPIKLQAHIVDDQNAVTTIDIDYDLRTLLGQSSATLAVKLPENLAKGDYQVFLSANDTISGTAIQFANTGVANNGWPLGALSIQ